MLPRVLDAGCGLMLVSLSHGPRCMTMSPRTALETVNRPPAEFLFGVAYYPEHDLPEHLEQEVGRLRTALCATKG